MMANNSLRDTMMTPLPAQQQNRMTIRQRFVTSSSAEFFVGFSFFYLSPLCWVVLTFCNICRALLPPPSPPSLTSSISATQIWKIDLITFHKRIQAFHTHGWVALSYTLCVGSPFKHWMGRPFIHTLGSPITYWLGNPFIHTVGSP
jgi:hypothetical protein